MRVVPAKLALSKSKCSILSLARLLLVAVWHILSKNAVDKHADVRSVACSLFNTAYRMRVRNLPQGLSAKQWVRRELDRLGIGREISQFRWGTKTEKLPPSTLKKKVSGVPNTQ
ncbi:MAG: IS110 family transposase [Chloroflexota bacterium]